jgi:hypothetical protein
MGISSYSLYLIGFPSDVSSGNVPPALIKAPPPSNLVGPRNVFDLYLFNFCGFNAKSLAVFTFCLLVFAASSALRENLFARLSSKTARLSEHSSRLFLSDHKRLIQNVATIKKELKIAIAKLKVFSYFDIRIPPASNNHST